MEKNSILLCENYDNTIRWKKGERLDHIFEERCDEIAAKFGDAHPAVAVADTLISYGELDEAANRLARHLLKKGVGPGSRVGVMLKQTPETYVTLLAILKLNAAYVPLDASFPKDRIAFIAKDAGVRLLISISDNRGIVDDLRLAKLFLDEEAGKIAKQGRVAVDRARSCMLPPAAAGQSLFDIAVQWRDLDGLVRGMEKRGRDKKQE